MEDARITAHKANIRSVRSAAVYKILTDDDEFAKKGSLGWLVKGKVVPGGDVQLVSIQALNDASYADGVSKSDAEVGNYKSYTAPDDAGKISIPDTGYWVRVIVKDTDLDHVS